MTNKEKYFSLGEVYDDVSYERDREEKRRDKGREMDPRLLLLIYLVMSFFDLLWILLAELKHSPLPLPLNPWLFLDLSVD